MTIYSFSNFGYEGSLVQVEVDLRRGIPAIDIVGLADGAVKETRERVRAAFGNSEIEFPAERVLISLSPADMRKEGEMALPMAAGIIAEQNKNDFEPVLILGELELSGHIRPVRGVHAAVATAKACGINRVIVCEPNKLEASAIEGVKVAVCNYLKEVEEVIKENKFESAELIESQEFDIVNGVEFRKLEDNEFLPDGLAKATKAMVVAMAGKLNMLFVGGPGCGKTLLMQRASMLQPVLTVDEAQTTTRVWSLAGLMKPSEPLVRIPPFRMPHQTASIEGICGGGPNCRPGEISLAHNGVLFLDEAAEFRTSVLQMLRVPLESRKITLSRAGRSTVFPANFQLLIAAEPCPCGNYGVENKICLCSARAVELFWQKFSAPLLSRIDIRVWVERDKSEAVDIRTAREMVANAIKVQRARGVYNGEMNPMQIAEVCKYTGNLIPDELGPRGIVSVLKIARTLADIEGVDEISDKQVAEALSLRDAIPFNF